MGRSFMTTGRMVRGPSVMSEIKEKINIYIYISNFVLTIIEMYCCCLFVVADVKTAQS